MEAPWHQGWVAAVGLDGARDPQEDPGGEPADSESSERDVQDAVPLEWIRKMELEAAAMEASRRAQRQHRQSMIERIVPAVIIGAVAITVIIVIGVTSTPSPSGPPGLPTAVQAFAKTLPASQDPNAAGLTVVDGTFAPNTWRVAWETESAAFCFAFVHQSEAPQTVCDGPRSVDTAKMRIAGELSDNGLTPPELITCGYTTGPGVYIRYVEIDGGSVVGTVTDMGSGLSAYCLQLPDGTAAGASFTVSTFVVDGQSGNNIDSSAVTATYP
jgi:hypothetical protein